MALMYDHEVEVTMTVFVRSTVRDGLDYKDDILEAVKEELEYMTVDRAFANHEIINTTAGDY
jgi:hypothetical protein